MDQPHLHLVDTEGITIHPRIASAVVLAYRWVARDYPEVDPALISNWAEDVASTMQSRVESLQFLDRFAYASLKGKVRDWMRTKSAQETVVGIGKDLERIAGINGSFQGSVDRKILFEQLKETLNERDRYILVLLLQDQTSPATVAEALGTTYPAAAKAIQRVKERIAAIVTNTRVLPNSNGGPARFCETKG